MPAKDHLQNIASLRRMHRAGWLLFAVWAAVLIAWGVFRPEPYARGWQLVLELLFVGRAVNIYDGIHLGFSRTYLFIQSGPQDIIMLMILYPWVIRAYESTLKKNVVGRGIGRVTATAEGHQNWLEPLGAIGLWAFVFFPFWSTGALVGGVVGYLLGMRTRVVFAVVILGHGLSVVTLVFFVEWIYPHLEAFNSGLARYFAWIVLAVLFLVAWIYQFATRSRRESISDRP
mgnify:CR=1 FL=1